MTKTQLEQEAIMQQHAANGKFGNVSSIPTDEEIEDEVRRDLKDRTVSTILGAVNEYSKTFGTQSVDFILDQVRKELSLNMSEKTREELLAEIAQLKDTNEMFCHHLKAHMELGEKIIEIVCSENQQLDLEIEERCGKLPF